MGPLIPAAIAAVALLLYPSNKNVNDIVAQPKAKAKPAASPQASKPTVAQNYGAPIIIVHDRPCKDLALPNNIPTAEVLFNKKDKHSASMEFKISNINMDEIRAAGGEYALFYLNITGTNRDTKYCNKCEPENLRIGTWSTDHTQESAYTIKVPITGDIDGNEYSVNLSFASGTNREMSDLDFDGKDEFASFRCLSKSARIIDTTIKAE